MMNDVEVVNIFGQEQFLGKEIRPCQRLRGPEMLLIGELKPDHLTIRVYDTRCSTIGMR